MTIYLLPALGITTLPVLYLVAIAAQFVLGAAGAVLFTVIMDRSDVETAGTDFTVQTSVVYFGSIGASVLSGIVAETLGYRGVFLVSIAIALLSVAAIVKAFKGTVIKRSFS